MAKSNQSKTTKTTLLPIRVNPSWSFAVDEVYPWAYWSEALSPAKCQEIIDHALTFEMMDAGINRETGVDFLTRSSRITWLYPSEKLDWLFRRVTDITVELNKKYFGFDLFGLIEGFQFTEYKGPLGHYGKHMDTTFKGPIRKLSVTIQLSPPESYEGGDLELYFSDIPDTTIREQGSMILFPSYTMHRVSPVISGTRYSLVGWVTGKPFV